MNNTGSSNFDQIVIRDLIRSKMFRDDTTLTRQISEFLSDTFAVMPKGR